MNQNVKQLILVIIGSIVGAALGNAIGAAIRSDNLPFFVLLGAAIGLGLSGVVSFVIVR